MSIGRIHYLIPDIFRRSLSGRDLVKSIRDGHAVDYLRNGLFPKHKPVGGIKIMYQHCMMLAELGYDARPLLMGRYRGNFFGYPLDFRALSEVGTVLPADDIVVSTEFRPYDGLRFSGPRKVLFLQNWANITGPLRAEDRDKSYLELGYDRVVSCSRYNTDIIEQVMGIPSATVTNGIDTGLFVPNPEARVPGRVLCLSRKNADDLHKIMALTGEHDIDFKVVDGLSQAELLSEYQSADVFLATGYPEGFSLPPLEAMSCGCAVVGFSGRGGLEFMHHRKTALVAQDGDCEAAAQLLLELLRDHALREELRSNGLQMAQRYSLARMRNELKGFFSSFA